MHWNYELEDGELRSDRPAWVEPEFTWEQLGFEPDARQREVLESQAGRGILNCTRQWGKSTVAAAKAVHRAYTRAGCLVLLC